jgi:hypothetical protein
MRTAVFGAILLVCLAAPAPVAAQGGDGSLRGTVRDEQGGAIPGVTITATSPALIAPAVAVSESDGTYRLVNLPPGTYTVQAEIQGFTTFRREGILLRAAANFQVDVTMGLGTVQETITVTGDSPMLEVSRPSNVLNIDADFQKQVPSYVQRESGTHVRDWQRAQPRDVGEHFQPAERWRLHGVRSNGTESYLQSCELSDLHESADATRAADRGRGEVLTRRAQ